MSDNCPLCEAQRLSPCQVQGSSQSGAGLWGEMILLPAKIRKLRPTDNEVPCLMPLKSGGVQAGLLSMT